MEIKIDKKSSNSYYSEVLAVMSNYQKLKDNPHAKLRGLTTQAMILTGTAFVFLIIFALLYME